MEKNKGRIIVLEGVKRSGKTTWAKRYMEENKNCFYFCNRELYKEDNSKDSVYGYMVGILESAEQILNEVPDCTIILDRFHITEYLYGLDRGYNNRDNMKKISHKLNELGAEVYLFNSETWEERVKNSKEHFVFDKYLNRARDVYKNKYYVVNLDNEFKSKKKFYIASPFFNDEQRERERRICYELRSNGHKVFAPYEHGVLNKEASDKERTDIFNENVNAIEDADYILAITDGKDIGTIWEAGYAYAVGKKIIYYAETLNGNPFNVMLGKSGSGIYTDFYKFRHSCKTGEFENDYYKEMSAT